MIEEFLESYKEEIWSQLRMEVQTKKKHLQVYKAMRDWLQDQLPQIGLQDAAVYLGAVEIEDSNFLVVFDSESGVQIDLAQSLWPTIWKTLPDDIRIKPIPPSIFARWLSRFVE